MEAEPGDIVLVARLKGAAWVSKAIQRYTGSWYSHALVALGDGRYAHAIPAPGGSVVVLDEAQLSRLITSGPVYDLFRPAAPPDPGRLEAAVAELHARARADAPKRESPCGFISALPAAVFSDGNLVALGALKFFENHPNALRLPYARRLRNALLVAAEDGEGRLLCSGFVHRVLDLAGARPAAPPPGAAFLDLTDFPTDELPMLGPPAVYEWLRRKLWETLDFDPLALRTCEEVAHVVACHFGRQTPVPEPLHRANFTTPGDLGLSPSLRKVASRFRLPNLADTGWSDPLALPPIGEPFGAEMP